MPVRQPMASKFYVGPCVDFMKCQPDWPVCHEKQKKFKGLQIDFLEQHFKAFLLEYSLCLLISLKNQMQFNSNKINNLSCHFRSNLHTLSGCIVCIPYSLSLDLNESWCNLQQ